MTMYLAYYRTIRLPGYHRVTGEKEHASLSVAANNSNMEAHVYRYYTYYFSIQSINMAASPLRLIPVRVARASVSFVASSAVNP